ncbi:hypothetical protein [Brevundimonas aurantiaca]|uniref:hypothetical protein n=1 Tax=Brevundimonas aurantiaca TaxID=74316 RepID=UPI002FDED390
MTRAELIIQIEAALKAARDRVGPHDWNDKTWHDRRRTEGQALVERLRTEFGANVREDWNGARLSLAGISSSSTSGVEGAVGNWIAAACRKEGQA